MPKFATNGIRTTLLYGIIGLTGIAQPTITMILELVTEYVVLVKRRIWIWIPSQGDKLWLRDPNLNYLGIL